MFWDNFVSLCNIHKVSPNGVAKQLGFSTGTVTWWKKGRIPRDTALKKIKNRLRNVSNPCLTRLCIMYERSGRVEEAMYICDIGEENGMNDNGASFTLRKERLKKKIAKMQ